MKSTWHLPNYVQTTGLAGLSPKILKIYKTIAVTSVLASLRSLSSSSLPSFLLAALLLPSSLLSLFASALAPPPRCAPPFSPLRLLTHLPSFLLAFLDFFICLFLALPFPCLYVTPPPRRPLSFPLYLPAAHFASLPICRSPCLPTSLCPSWVFLLAFLWPCLSLVFASLPPSPSSLFSSLPTCRPFRLPPHLPFSLPAYLLFSLRNILLIIIIKLV